MKHSSIYHCVSPGYSHRQARSLLLATALILTLGVTYSAFGQAASQDPANANLSDPERQRETLDWLDKYLTDTDLMRPEDVAKIRTAVTQMSPSQLDRWLTQTRQLREYVEIPAWQETKKWLRGFLKVQAMYSDQEVQEFREKLFNADADQMLAILQRIQAKHESMVWMHQASNTSRQMAVEARNATVARQDAANTATQTTARRDVPLYGNAGGSSGGGKPDSGYRIPGPLVDSMSMARWTAWTGAW
ncbi:MAG: hypothetical protein ACYC3X_08970 [Pirellulaceae bacterium]